MRAEVEISTFRELGKNEIRGIFPLQHLSRATGFFFLAGKFVIPARFEKGREESFPNNSRISIFSRSASFFLSEESHFLPKSPKVGKGDRSLINEEGEKWMGIYRFSAHFCRSNL